MDPSLKKKLFHLQENQDLKLGKIEMLMENLALSVSVHVMKPNLFLERTDIVQSNNRLIGAPKNFVYVHTYSLFVQPYINR